MLATTLCAAIAVTLVSSIPQGATTSLQAKAENSIATPLRVDVEVRLKDASAKEKFVLEKGEHDIVDLIRRSGKFIGRRYLLDKSQAPALCTTNSPANKVEIARRVELDAEDCEDFVGQILLTKGWIAVQINREQSLFDWIFMSGPKGAMLKSRARHMAADDILKRPRKAELVSCNVKLEKANAQLVTATLRQYHNDPRGLITLIPVGQKTVFVSGFRHVVSNMIRSIREADENSTYEQTKIDARIRALEKRLRRLEAQRPTPPGSRTGRKRG